MQFKMLKWFLYIFCTAYLIFSILFKYSELLNNILFVISFSIMTIELIRMLLKQSSFQIFRYSFYRVKQHLKPKKAGENIEDVAGFYRKNTVDHFSPNFLLVINTLIFLESVILAFIKQ